MAKPSVAAPAYSHLFQCYNMLPKTMFSPVLND